MKTLLLVFLFAVPNLSWAASFDCSKAHYEIEKIICGSKYLNQLDSDLGKYYSKLVDTVQKTPPPGYYTSPFYDLTDSQKKWVRSRDQRCKTLNENCLIELYELRILSLIHDYGYNLKYPFDKPVLKLKENNFEILEEKFSKEKPPILLRALLKSKKPKIDLIGDFNFFEIEKLPSVLGVCLRDESCESAMRGTENGVSWGIGKSDVKTKNYIYKSDIYNPQSLFAAAKSDFNEDGFADILVLSRANTNQAHILTKTTNQHELYEYIGFEQVCLNEGLKIKCEWSDSYNWLYLKNY